MTSDTTKCDSLQPAEAASAGFFDNWFDPIESALRDRVRGFIEELIRDELEDVLGRPRYARRAKEAEAAPGTAGPRHGSRRRRLTGTFGKSEITVPRARLHTPDGKTAEWRSSAL